MKANSFLIVAILFIAAFLPAKTQAQFSGGIKAGAGFTKFKTSSGNSMKTKTGLILGGFATYDLSQKIGLQGEILYSQQGAKEGSGSYEFNYINVPLSFRYTIVDGLHAFTGPQIGFLTSAKTNSGGQKQDIKDNVKSSDFAWLLGAGYELNNGLFADARFIKGLSDISDNSNKTKNTGFQLTLGYRFKRK